MKKNILHIESIEEAHQFLKLGTPQHPLITVFKFGREQSQSFIENFKFSLGLYKISMIVNCQYTISKYGRNSYDFQEGSMIFTSPNQVLEFNNKNIEDDRSWTLLFHPDLIRQSDLGERIYKFSFFQYASNEALHISEEERTTVSSIIDKIIEEYSKENDPHSQILILSHLELLLNYCVRFYDRQFHTRTNVNKDLVTKFELFITNYFNQNLQIQSGIPSVETCGDAMNMSGKYLSDLLKAETGKSLIEHIHLFIVDRAKTSLLQSNRPISEIAYSLGFTYPQHFTRLFKTKTELSPKEFRGLHEMPSAVKPPESY